MRPHRNSIKIGFSILLFLYSIVCLAKISPPSIPVADRTDAVTFSFQKDSPTDLYIWKNVSGGKGSINSTPQPIDDYNYYGRMSWACTSDSTFGSCPTTVEWNSDSITIIALTFTEIKTGIKKILILRGRNYKAAYDNSQTSESLAMRNAASNNLVFAQSLLDIHISKQELNTIPIGGIWKATLVINQWRWDPTFKVATWTAHITLNVVDRKNIQIYLPNYNTASPTVDLKLRNMPSAPNNPILSGNVNIEACLYDGYNAQSSRYDITMSDPNSKDEKFYITKKARDPNPKLSNTIPYQVWVSTPGAPSIASKKVLSNEPFSFTDVAQSTPKSVTLPNVPNPVYCTPWLINLKTANITQKNQAPGRYQGSLHFKFTPASSSL
ncbi:CfaE/CblD family pilus tip adhesin [Pseudomonas poae]|uniref:CfaE/CblD family pilus tip adhesin n=1 Tax=Pseudomonas poae TaxID=200451 RepID=UPI0030D2D64E